MDKPFGGPGATPLGKFFGLFSPLWNRLLKLGFYGGVVAVFFM